MPLGLLLLLLDPVINKKIIGSAKTSIQKKK